MSIRNITVADLTNTEVVDAVVPHVKAALKVGTEFGDAKSLATVKKQTVGTVAKSLFAYRKELETRAEKSELTAAVKAMRAAAREQVGSETPEAPESEDEAPAPRKRKAKGGRVRKQKSGTESLTASNLTAATLREAWSSLTVIALEQDGAYLYCNEERTLFSVVGPKITGVQFFDTACEAAAEFGRQHS